MTLTIKGISVLSVSLLLSASAYAQDPGVAMQDLTSKISVTDVDGFALSQQIASPFGSLLHLEGDDVLYQGLFGALYGNNGNMSGIEGIFSDCEGFAIAYDAVVKSLAVQVPDGKKAQVFVVDMSGATILSQNINSGKTRVDISTLAPGVYMAGIASDNKFSKTLKFILK